MVRTDLTSGTCTFSVPSAWLKKVQWLPCREVAGIEFRSLIIRHTRSLTLYLYVCVCVCVCVYVCVCVCMCVYVCVYVLILVSFFIFIMSLKGSNQKPLSTELHRPIRCPQPVQSSPQAYVRDYSRTVIIAKISIPAGLWLTEVS